MSYNPDIYQASKPQNLTAKLAAAFPILLILLISPVSAYAINVDEMLTNIQEQIPALTQFVTGFAYLAGFFFIFKAIYALKQYGDMRTMTSSNADLRGPITSAFVGAALAFSPTVISITLTTAFGDDSLMAYPDTSTGWDQMGKTLVNIVYFVGGIAFIRGIMHLHKVGQGQAQQNTFSKGIIHIIGGIMALNITAVTNILFTTLGIE